MADNRPIGVFDSGLGGLTVVKELCNSLPGENIVYFGDTGRVPYGNRSRDTIRRYAVEDEKFLLRQDVKLIVAACGTVSSVAADTAVDLPIPFFEVVSHACEQAVKATRNGRIGVIGTAATINSGKHKEYINNLMPEATVTSASCPLFVPLVEEGWYSNDDVVVVETVKRYLEPMQNAGVDTLILGCTHYPVLDSAIAKVMGKGVSLINMGVATAEAVGKFLAENDMLNVANTGGATSFFVTDKADSFRKQASILLGTDMDDGSVKQVSLGSL